jgi:hypothetical protein
MIFPSDLPATQQAEFRRAVDSGKFARALALLPPASQPAAAAQLWESLPPAIRPHLVADLLNAADPVGVPSSALLAGFLATALRKIRESGHIVTDTAASLRRFRALPPVVIVWRASAAGLLPAEGLIWYVRREDAEEDAREILRRGAGPVIYALRLPRHDLAGMLRGLRVVIEPRHAMGAESVNVLGLEDEDR